MAQMLDWNFEPVEIDFDKVWQAFYHACCMSDPFNIPGWDLLQYRIEDYD